MNVSCPVDLGGSVTACGGLYGRGISLSVWEL